MSDERDVAAFDRRASGYDDGWLGRFHRDIAQRVAAIADSVAAEPDRVLDVGCGTGLLLRFLAAGNREASAFIGIDPSSAMVDVARRAARDERIQVRVGRAEQLPFDDASFCLVVSTTSFDHWSEQAAGLRECARVLDPDGVLVLADLFSPVLVPTMRGSRRNKARTRARAESLASDAGLTVDGWHKVGPLMQAFVARRAT